MVKGRLLGQAGCIKRVHPTRETTQNLIFFYRWETRRGKKGTPKPDLGWGWQMGTGRPVRQLLRGNAKKGVRIKND